jgi:hypothetical protein
MDMPGKIDGLALAQWVLRSQVDTRIILTSGAAGALGGANEYASFLSKPYAEKDVVYRLQFLGHRVEPYAALAAG